MRYFEMLGSTNGLESYGVGQAAGSSRALGVYSFKVEKRVAPIVTVNAVANWCFINTTITSFVPWSTTSFQSSKAGCSFDVGTSTAGLGTAGTATLWGPNATAAARMYFDARL